MMPNTSFLTTAVALPSAGIAILARLTIAEKWLIIAAPTNAQWKGSEKLRTQTRPRNATRHVT